MTRLPETSTAKLIHSIIKDLEEIEGGESIWTYLPRIGNYYDSKDRDTLKTIERGFKNNTANCYQPTLVALYWGLKQGYRVGFRLFESYYPHPFGFVDDGDNLIMFDYFAEVDKPTRVSTVHRTESANIIFLKDEKDLITSAKLFDLLENLTERLESSQLENGYLLSEIMRLDFSENKNAYRYALHLVGNYR
jgi:hypothetical protein